jgi:hypothetical protein
MPLSCSFAGLKMNEIREKTSIFSMFFSAEYRRCFLRELGLISHKFFAGRYPSQGLGQFNCHLYFYLPVATTSVIAPMSTIQGNTTQIPSASRANK